MTSSTTPETDLIERSILINAARSKVWRALANAEDFGTWFGVNLKEKTFEPSRRLTDHLRFKGARIAYSTLLSNRSCPNIYFRSIGTPTKKKNAPPLPCH
jgi:hypothetical protein